MKAHLSRFISSRSDGALVGLFPPMLHFPEFGKAVWANVQALIENSKLPKPAHEVAILALGAAFGSRCELYAHEIVATGAGLSPARIATIVAGQRPSGLDPTESICYDVAVVLASGEVLPKATYQPALQTFGEKQVAELIYLVANWPWHDPADCEERTMPPRNAPPLLLLAEQEAPLEKLVRAHSSGAHTEAFPEYQPRLAIASCRRCSRTVA